MFGKSVLLFSLCACLLCAGIVALAPAAAAQTSPPPQVTSELIGTLTGTLQIPGNPVFPGDTVAFTGNVHVVAIWDTATGTVDYHINLMNVKGIGTLGKYVGVGTASVPNQIPGNPVRIFADVVPPGALHTVYDGKGGLPITVTATFDESWNLSSVNAVVTPVEE
jgi:hypothetical protein